MQTFDNPNVKITTAKYTHLLKDIPTDKELALKQIFNSFGETNKLNDMFISKYRYYEICDNDWSVFLQCINDVFNEYHDYYTELLTNYNKEYDYSIGNKKIVNKSSTSSKTGQTAIANTNSNTNREYDLPNRVVDSSSEDGYLTSKSKRDGTNNTSSNDSESSSSSSADETIYQDEFLTLKKQYLSQIRNVYNEFAEKFSVCFLHVF